MQPSFCTFLHRVFVKSESGGVDRERYARRSLSTPWSKAHHGRTKRRTYDYVHSVGVNYVRPTEIAEALRVSSRRNLVRTGFVDLH